MDADHQLARVGVIGGDGDQVSERSAKRVIVHEARVHAGGEGGGIAGHPPLGRAGVVTDEDAVVLAEAVFGIHQQIEAGAGRERGGDDVGRVREIVALQWLAAAIEARTIDESLIAQRAAEAADLLRVRRVADVEDERLERGLHRRGAEDEEISDGDARTQGEVPEFGAREMFDENGVRKIRRVHHHQSARTGRREDIARTLPREGEGIDIVIRGHRAAGKDKTPDDARHGGRVLIVERTDVHDGETRAAGASLRVQDVVSGNRDMMRLGEVADVVRPPAGLIDRGEIARVENGRGIDDVADVVEGDGAIALSATVIGTHGDHEITPMHRHGADRLAGVVGQQHLPQHARRIVHVRKSRLDRHHVQHACASEITVIDMVRARAARSMGAGLPGRAVQEQSGHQDFSAVVQMHLRAARDPHLAKGGQRIHRADREHPAINRRVAAVGVRGGQAQGARAGFHDSR